jgi:N-acetylneuraminic acid mutarotase
VVLNTLEAYSRWTGTWSTLPSMPTARFRLAAATGPCPLGQSGSCVYFLGGNTVAGDVNTVEAYSQLRNNWTTLAPMPTARRDLAAATVGGRIYAIGGELGATVLNTVEVYNPATNTWSTVGPMPTTRDELGVTAAPCLSGTGTCVYAVGGENAAGASLNTFEAYTP